MATTVFISYSRQDTDCVQRLIADLKSKGIAVWLDHERLRPGESDWEAAVRKGIISAQGLIYVGSEDAAASRYVRDELAIAQDNNVRVFPIWARGTKWSSCVPLGWGRTQYVDCRDESYTENLAHLLAAIERKIAVEIVAIYSAAMLFGNMGIVYAPRLRGWYPVPGSITSERLQEWTFGLGNGLLKSGVASRIKGSNLYAKEESNLPIALRSPGTANRPPFRATRQFADLMTLSLGGMVVGGLLGGPVGNVLERQRIEYEFEAEFTHEKRGLYPSVRAVDAHIIVTCHDSVRGTREYLARHPGEQTSHPTLFVYFADTARDADLPGNPATRIVVPGQNAGQEAEPILTWIQDHVQ